MSPSTWTAAVHCPRRCPRMWPFTHLDAVGASRIAFCHCLSLISLPLHCLFTAFSLPFHCLFAATPLPFHCLLPLRTAGVRTGWPTDLQLYAPPSCALTHKRRSRSHHWPLQLALPDDDDDEASTPPTPRCTEPRPWAADHFLLAFILALAAAMRSAAHRRHAQTFFTAFP